ncbi:hypothetical protein H0H81_000207 [Sphagnurus paluster]|uniref:Uncharacterized protein n=1 Tax=Sphagnurus paluster TaxID=117069 RepID=A0A9P7FTA2_9AGAR|nr:hypothetical protein H0H81_000207 [Sphagnurus paluster]
MFDSITQQPISTTSLASRPVHWTIRRRRMLSGICWISGRHGVSTSLFLTVKPLLNHLCRFQAALQYRRQTPRPGAHHPPDLTSQKLLVLGQVARNDQKDGVSPVVVVHPYFAKTWDKKCGDNDYMEWYARPHNSECLMGISAHNFAKNNGKCGPEPIPTGVCKGGADEMYNGSSGYRKILGNMCVGRLEKDIKIEKPRSQDRGGYVDFETMVGLDGIALVNVVSNPDEAKLSGREVFQSLIRHNDGSIWTHLNPPSIDFQGRSYDRQGTCQLHVHGHTECTDPRASYSSPTVPGLIIAVGNIDQSLAPYTDSDTFLSRDDGFTWEEVHKDAHLWESIGESTSSAKRRCGCGRSCGCSLEYEPWFILLRDFMKTAGSAMVILTFRR